MRELLEDIELDGIPLFPNYYDDDTADRLNHRQTTALFAAFALMVVTMQFVGEPINCWPPAHFKKKLEDYTDSHCWTHGTYYLPLEADIPSQSIPKLDNRASLESPGHSPSKDRARFDGKPERLSYYQYVPLILLVQALGFYLPYCAWTRLNGSSGLDLRSLLEAAHGFDSASDMADVQNQTLLDMTRQMNRYLSSRTALGNWTGHWTTQQSRLTRCMACCMTLSQRRHGNYLIRVYLLVKLLYLVNVVAQLFLLDLGLGAAYHRYGVDVVADFLNNGTVDWASETSVRFPHVTMCNLKLHQLGAVHDYNIMCVLPINLFNEKIFLFVWFWLVFVGIATFSSLLMWIVRFSCTASRQRYVRRHVHYADPVETPAQRRRRKRKAREFVYRYLDQDGVFLLRLVAHNTSTITVTELTGALWKNYRNKPGVDKDSDIEDELNVSVL